MSSGHEDKKKSPGKRNRVSEALLRAERDELERALRGVVESVDAGVVQLKAAIRQAQGTLDAVGGKR